MKLFTFKKIICTISLLLIYSCSNEPIENNTTLNIYQNYGYNESEIDLLSKINTYRNSIGKTSYEIIDHISFLALEHNEYMIASNNVGHDNFQYRVENIKERFNLNAVTENIAYNYNNPNEAFNAWLNSELHKTNLENDFTHCGISIASNTSGQKYYTLIIARK